MSRRLIDANALTDDILKSAVMIDDRGIQTGYEIAIELIKRQPTIDAEPVCHGKWIYSNDFHWYTASCNKCGYQRRTDIKADGWNQWKFCPNCGARMDRNE